MLCNAATCSETDNIQAEEQGLNESALFFQQ